MTGAITSIARLGVSLIPDLAAFAGIGQQAADAGKKFGDAWNKAFLDKQKEGTAPWLQAFTKDMQDARMVAARGGQLASESFLGGLQGIKAGNPQQIFNTMTNAIQGVTAAFGGAGQAVAGLIPQIGPALGAAIGIGTDAMQLFIDTGGGYLTMLTEIGDKYLTASRTLSGSLIDHQDIDATLSSIREIMASGAVDHFADVENSIGRFSRALNLSGEDLTDFTQMYAAAVELLGNFDPTNTAGIMRAFDVNPDEMAEKLQQLTNIVRDTGGEMGRIQDQMIRSGPAFRELGYGISETAYFFGKQIEEGERGTKLVYGINQMVDKLNKGVQAGTFKDLESGWRQMIAVVKDLDAAGQKSTALDILGQYTTPTNATLWLEEIRKGILLTPEAMSKAVQSYDQDIAKTAAKTTDLAGVFENISQTFEAALMPIGMTLASGLVGAGNQVVTWMSENQRLIADWGAEVANWFLGGAGAIAGALGGIMTSLSGIVDQAKWLIVESIQVVMNAVRLPLDALAAITPDFLGGDAIRGISDALNQVDKGLQGIQDSNWSDGFAKAGDVLTNVNKQVPEFQENLRRASEGFAASLDISDALKADLDATRDGLEDVFKGLTKGQSANSPMMQLLGGPQEWATAKANMQALGLTLTVTTGGMVTAVTAANAKAQESWESWYAAESKKKIKVEVEATKDGSPISDSNPLVPPGTTTVEVQPGSSAPTAAPATPGWTGGPTGGKVYTTPSGATGAAAPSAPPELKNPSPYLPGTEPGATPSSATPSSAVASATPPATLPGPAPAAPAAPLAAESGYAADAPAGSPGVYPSVATVPFNEYSAPSPNSHPRTETWNKDYTQLLNETATPEKPSLIVLHSSEGNQGATEQAASMESSGKSYHFIVDKDGKTVLDVVDTSQAAKSVYDPGNNKSINIGMAGTFADQWGKSDWLARSDQLRTTAAIAVREAVEAGIPASIIQSQSGGSGIVGHDWVAENIGVPPGGEAHSDPGDNFPWAEFSQFVQDAAAAMTGVQAPVAPVAAAAPVMAPGLTPAAPYVPTLPGPAPAAPYVPILPTTAAPSTPVAPFTPSVPPSVTNPLPVAVVSPKPAAVAPFVQPPGSYSVPSAGLVTPGVPYIPRLPGRGAAPAPKAPGGATPPSAATGGWNSADNDWWWWQNARGETFWVAPGAPRPTVPKDAGTMNAATNGYWSSMPDADGKSVMVFRPMATAPATPPALVPPASPPAPKAPPAPGAKAGAETQGPAPYKPSGLTNPYTGQPGQQGFTPPASQPPRPPQAGVSSGGKLKSYLEIAADNAVEATKDLIEQGNSRAAEVWEWTTNAWEWTSNFLRYGNQENRKADGGVIKRSAGGAVFGAGTATSDSIPAWLSNGEFVQKTAAVEHYGLDFMHAINEKRLPKFNTGGEVSEKGPRAKGRDLDSAVSYLKGVDGTPYVLGGLDCTQLVEEAVTRYRGMPSPGALWTGNQGDWLAQLGFQPGLSGAFKVGWGGQDVNTSEGGHTAMTLPNGVNAESAGGSVKQVRYGRGARGATDPMFSNYASFASGGLATHMPSVGDEGNGRPRIGGFPGLWKEIKNIGSWIGNLGAVEPHPSQRPSNKSGLLGGSNSFADGGEVEGGLGEDFNSGTLGLDIFAWIAKRFNRANDALNEEMFGRRTVVPWSDWGFSEGGEVGHTRIGDDFKTGTRGLDIVAWLAKRFNRANDALNEEMFGRRTVVPWSDWGFAGGGLATHKPDLGGGGSGDKFGYTDWGDNWEEYWRWVNKTGTPVGREVDSRGLPTDSGPVPIEGGFPGLWKTAKSLLGFEEGGAPGSGGSASGSLDEWLKAQGLDASKPALTWEQLQAAAAAGPKAPTIGLPSGRTITPNTSKSNSLGLGSTPNVNAAPGAKAQQNLTDLAAGFQGSAQSAVEGTVEAIQDPAAAAKALAPLINAGGEGAPGAGEAWVNVAKGMTHWDEWEDNPYGAAGGVSFDIGSLIYGGGAAATSKVAREATIPGAIGAAARNSRAGQAIAKPVGAATSAVNIGLANAQARIGAMGANMAPALDMISTFGGGQGALAAMAVAGKGSGSGSDKAKKIADAAAAAFGPAGFKVKGMDEFFADHVPGSNGPSQDQDFEDILALLEPVASANPAIAAIDQAFGAEYGGPPVSVNTISQADFDAIEGGWDGIEAAAVLHAETQLSSSNPPVDPDGAVDMVAWNDLYYAKLDQLLTIAKDQGSDGPSQGMPSRRKTELSNWRLRQAKTAPPSIRDTGIAAPSYVDVPLPFRNEVMKFPLREADEGFIAAQGTGSGPYSPLIADVETTYQYLKTAMDPKVMVPGDTHRMDVNEYSGGGAGLNSWARLAATGQIDRNNLTSFDRSRLKLFNSISQATQGSRLPRDIAVTRMMPDGSFFGAPRGSLVPDPEAIMGQTFYKPGFLSGFSGIGLAKRYQGTDGEGNPYQSYGPDNATVNPDGTVPESGYGGRVAMQYIMPEGGRAIWMGHEDGLLSGFGKREFEMLGAEGAEFTPFDWTPIDPNESDPNLAGQLFSVHYQQPKAPVRVFDLKGQRPQPFGRKPALPFRWESGAPELGSNTFDKLVDTGGSHGAEFHTSADGRKWIVKPYGADGGWHAEVDLATAKIQQISGLPTPQTHVMQIDGRTASVQEMFMGGNAFTKAGFDSADLSTADRIALQKHQILDWLIANHDPHADQWVRSGMLGPTERRAGVTNPNGELVGIDKGQGFKWFGLDELKLGAKYNNSETVYNKMMKAYVEGRADFIDPTDSNLRGFIENLQGIDDNYFKDIIRPFAEQAAAQGKLLKHTKPEEGRNTTPLKTERSIQPNDVEGFLQAVVDRKNTLGKDFMLLWNELTEQRNASTGVAPAMRAPGRADRGGDLDANGDPYPIPSDLGDFTEATNWMDTLGPTPKVWEFAKEFGVNDAEILEALESFGVTADEVLLNGLKLTTDQATKVADILELIPPGDLIWDEVAQQYVPKPSGTKKSDGIKKSVVKKSAVKKAPVRKAPEGETLDWEEEYFPAQPPAPGPFAPAAAQLNWASKQDLPPAKWPTALEMAEELGLDLEDIAHYFYNNGGALYDPDTYPVKFSTKLSPKEALEVEGHFSGAAKAADWQSLLDPDDNSIRVHVLAKALGVLPKDVIDYMYDVADFPVTASTKLSYTKASNFFNHLQNKSKPPTPPFAGWFPGDPDFPDVAPPFATGGAVFGAGTATSDSIPAWLSNGEFVQNAAAVQHYGVDFMHRLNRRQLPKFAEGGDVAVATAMNGLEYSQTSNPRTDCSGSVSLVVNGALGLPQESTMTTRDAEPWLTGRGFVPGEGADGEMTVYWYNNGPNPNDGHMTMRLSNGAMFESGGASGDVTYGANPDMGPMTYAMHRPLYGYGQGEATGGGGSGSTSSFSVPSQSGGGGGGGSLSFGPQAYGGNAPGNPYTNMPGGLSADEQKAYQRAYMGWQQNQAQIQAEIIAATAAQGKASKEWTDQLEKSKAKRAELDEAEAALVRMGPAAANINTAARDKRDALLKEFDGINAVAQTMQLASINADKRLQTAKEREILANFDGPPKPPKGKGQQVDKDAQKLGEGFVKGVFEGLGFGDIFGSDPTQWGIWKLLTGGLSYGMNLLGPGLSIPGGALGGNTTQSAAYGAGNAVIPGVADLIPGLKPGGVEPSASVTPAMATSQAPMAADGLSTGAPSINMTTNVNNNGMTTPQEYQNTWDNAHLAQNRALPSAAPANGGAGLVSVGPGS